MVASTVLHGNGIARVRFDGGSVAELMPVPWPWVFVEMLRSGRLRYTASPQWLGLTPGPWVLLSDEVVHLRDRSGDGIIGIPRLRRAGTVVLHALAVQEAASALWDNSIMPSVAVSIPGRMRPEDKAGAASRYRVRLQRLTQPGEGHHP